MDTRLEQALEKVIYTLQKDEGSLTYSRLAKRLLTQGHDQFYSLENLIKRLKEEGYVDEDSNFSVTLTKIGKEFNGFYDIKYKKYLEQKKEDLNFENLELQNENLKNQNASQAEIDRLTIENLKLQNKQLKRYVIYSLIGFSSGAIITNISTIIGWIKKFIN